MEKSYYEQEWEKLKNEVKESRTKGMNFDLYKPIDEEKYKRAPAQSWPDDWQKHEANMKEVRSICPDDGTPGKLECSREMREFWPSVDTPTNRPITEEEFKEHCGPEVYAKVEEIRRERRFYDIMEGKIECSEEMKKFWPIVDTSTNARRQVPEPWPWWFTLIGMIGGLIWFYVILKYLIAPN